ncbi:MAG: phosphotransferase, partial [Actinomycetia bacterium]|nr:phosphotransferase [Actinomycetes bacterium]
DGKQSWHALLISNADRYIASIGAEDTALPEEGRDMLGRHLGDIPTSHNPSLVHFDLRPGNILVGDGRLVGIIDFESCRGGHPSMDFFKLWQQVSPHLPGGLVEILQGYREMTETTELWTEPTSLDRLMQIYAAYHGLAGLGWCHTRGDFNGDFPAVNRGLIRDATIALD